MPSRIWSHLCDYATVDASGKTTIVGEFDHIFAPSIPFGYPLLFVVSKWNGSQGESFTEQVKIMSPNRSEIAATPVNTVVIDKVTDGIGIHTAVNAFMMVQLPKYGEYSIEILINNVPVHILPLYVGPVPAPAPIR